MVSLDEKRSKFLEYEKEAKRRKKKILAGFLIFTVLGVGIFMWLNNKPYKSEVGGNYFIGRELEYKGKKIEMTTVMAKVNTGKFILPLQTIIDKKIIYTEYKGDGKKVYYNKLKVLPITAFVTPSGRVVVASSICEPCYGQKFYIEDNRLVCIACGTRWRLNDLQGEMGGCVKYPPEEFKYTVENGNIVIDENLFKNWKPRYFTNEMSR